MDDFEFSVDISDRDWQCFFSQCEECNVLPPALAGLEDSGMSDMDDLGAAFAKRVQKKDLNTGLLEEDEPAGSPCESHLEELYLGKHSLGGIESVLSGSEEDIHLQSVNMFFEQMKSSSDSKKTAEQGQVGATQNRAVQGQLRGGGLSAKCTDRALPKNIPNLNSVSARGEAATGAKTTEPVSTIRNTYSVRTDESSSESSTSLYIRHPYLKTQLYIESSPENTANEHSPLNKADTSTPHSNKVIYMDKETCMSDVKDHSSYRKTSDLRINPGLVVNGKWTEDKSTQISLSDTDSTCKPLSKESSPCASVKRKRRKKRRLSVEPVENLFTCERLYDSEDELFTWRRAIDPCFCNWSGLKHQHIKCGFMPPLGQYTLSSSLPAEVEAKEIQPKPHHSQYQSVLTHANLVPTGLTKIWPSIETKTNGGFAGDKELIKVKEDLKVTGIPLENVASSHDNNRNEVKSLTDSIFPSAESNQRVAIGQDDRGSIAKLVIMREEAETKKVSQCQRETETHQQLETQSPIACQSCHMVENMTPPPCKRSISTVTELLDHKARHDAPQSADMASKETSSILHNQSLIPCNLTMDGTVQKLEYHIENGTNQVDLSQNHQITDICETEAPQELDEGNLIASGNTDQLSELQALLENQSWSTSYSTLSSCQTPETELQTNENILQTLECTAVTQNGLSLQEESTQVISKDGKMDAVLLNKVQRLSNDVEEPCWDQLEVAMTNCESEELIEPVKSDNTVFAMSSFWKEMEKLTINDILGLRKENKAQSSFLPSLQETDDSDCFTLSDLGCCSQGEEKKHDQKCKDVRLTIPGPGDYNLSCGDTSSSVLWENKPVTMSLPPANVYNNKITLNDISGPQISPDVPRGLRRMSKNITLQNLHSLESDPFSYKCNSQSTVKLQIDDTSNDIGYLPEDPVPKGDLKLSSIIENFRISISDIYSYFFCDKQPDSHLEPPIEDIVSHFTAGDSVSENYDHFFSEFDTDTFFYTGEVKPELVPIFSCSRSSKTKMKFHDPYDYFLVSSSDNSSSESDEEDSKECSPIRVVTRFTRKASSKDIVTDAYEHFYTDRDLKQDFFKTTFSFRNFNFNENNASKKTTTNAKLVRPLQQESRSYNIKAMPITVLGNQEFVFPDSVLCDFDDQIITKLQQPLIYENLQTAVANPNLDAPLLPLKQSDMCLICIAFASWVLKTANPQVGDAWKAVLLANVSALSAIRYLRKYVKGETKADEKKPNLKALLYPESRTK